MAEFSEKAAERHIRRELRAMDWTPETIEQIMSCLGNLDGFWSYGTARAIKDLAEIYAAMVEDRGEPPDLNW